MIDFMSSWVPWAVAGWWLWGLRAIISAKRDGWASSDRIGLLIGLVIAAVFLWFAFGGVPWRWHGGEPARIALAVLVAVWGGVGIGGHMAFFGWLFERKRG